MYLKKDEDFSFPDKKLLAKFLFIGESKKTLKFTLKNI
tara:strand:+ start:419 stop:532 length:114 start_codon:yes stop_codon:yes gene_type:complete